METFIETFSGINFNFNDPKPDEIDIEDIAHALGMQCRFAGQIRKFYSVAEHSLNVARLVPNEFKLTALLHDASEAYLTDVPSPVKVLLPDYNRLESVVQEAIANKFGLVYPFPIEIHEADRACLIAEARSMLPVKNKNHWSYSYSSIYELEEKYIVGHPPTVIDKLFLLRFKQYLNQEFPIAA